MEAVATVNRIQHLLSEEVRVDQLIFSVAAVLAIVSVGSIIGILIAIAIGKLYNGTS